MTELSHKIALVTGGSRGLGQDICLGLAREGADIAVNFHTHGEEAEFTARQVEGLGQRAIAVYADVSKAEEIAAMMVEVERDLGPVDILVNNAGMIRPQGPEEVTEADWNEVVDVNLKSAFLCIQAVLPGMIQRRWGRIINISSLAAQVGGLVGPHYSAAKAGMLGLTHYYAIRLVREGITVNAVAPALIDTDMVRSNPNVRPDLVPIGRYGRVAEHTDAVVMLARNGYITGQTINVNGGMYFS